MKNLMEGLKRGREGGGGEVFAQKMSLSRVYTVYMTFAKIRYDTCSLRTQQLNPIINDGNDHSIKNEKTKI